MRKLTAKGNEEIPKNYKLTPEEKETVITFDDSSNICTIFTCNKTLIKDLKAKGYKVIKEDKYSTTFECNKSLLTFRNSRRKKRKPLTEEQKLKMQEARKKATKKEA